MEAKLAARLHKGTSKIALGDGVVCGGRALTIIAGPCSVESQEQIETSARFLSGLPVQCLRGGVYKPRTSPYAFQGLGPAGADLLQAAGKKYDLPVVTEVMAADQIELLSARAAVLQIGSRNMQNFDLLKAVGRTRHPILLKRGLAATIDEFLLAAEYVMAAGNENVILCERGIRSFDPSTRNVLDLGAVVALKQLTHLPVIVDPSHAAGRSELVPALARAAIACGADGLIIECHPEPAKSVSDARQALSFQDMEKLVTSLYPLAAAVGRELVPVSAAGGAYVYSSTLPERSIKYSAS